MVSELPRIISVDDHIVEPQGLARLWQIAKEKLRLWPFPH